MKLYTHELYTIEYNAKIYNYPEKVIQSFEKIFYQNIISKAQFYQINEDNSIILILPMINIKYEFNELLNIRISNGKLLLVRFILYDIEQKFKLLFKMIIKTQNNVVIDNSSFITISSLTEKQKMTYQDTFLNNLMYYRYITTPMMFLISDLYMLLEMIPLQYWSNYIISYVSGQIYKNFKNIMSRSFFNDSEFIVSKFENANREFRKLTITHKILKPKYFEYKCIYNTKMLKCYPNSILDCDNDAALEKASCHSGKKNKCTNGFIYKIGNSRKTYCKCFKGYYGLFCQNSYIINAHANYVNILERTLINMYRKKYKNMIKFYKCQNFSYSGKLCEIQCKKFCFTKLCQYERGNITCIIDKFTATMMFFENNWYIFVVIIFGAIFFFYCIKKNYFGLNDKLESILGRIEILPIQDSNYEHNKIEETLL